MPSKTFIKTILERLGQMREEVLSKVEKSKFDLGEGEEEKFDPHDMSSLQRTKEIGIIKSSIDTELLDQIDIAVSKIERGEYGYCEDCGEEIADSRLMAMPFATLCFDCQSKREYNEKLSSFAPEEEEEEEEEKEITVKEEGETEEEEIEEETEE